MTEASAPSCTSSPGHGPILLVDDDDDIRLTLAEYIGFHGYRVITAANGQEALEVLEREGSACVILLDLMMPVMDGYAFRAAQRKVTRLADIPVVVITAGTQVRREEVEATEVFRKPLDLERLMSTIEHHC